MQHFFQADQQIGICINAPLRLFVINGTNNAADYLRGFSSISTASSQLYLVRHGLKRHGSTNSRFV
ncbi:MAG: hypothetical protein OI74_11515 [Gammaproteobacteria bacterium (ex Lamellibrachia satsuma)]|nr:MAG: hypothetical protein OI74_11515 [Gammaproteobacteria bacterium (ex Lamellibrachia satsuma)]RRS35782.1 MAG: hypothetical protein NV67_09635 [Gammaproteobacteria bacterium (ex Lamellibrachia satsuma)]